MRSANTADMENLPPPPYTEVADGSDAVSQPVQARLRGGYMRPSLPSEMPADENSLLSAATYFESRYEPDLHRAGAYLDSVEYTLSFNAKTTRDDLAFPLPIEASVARNVTNLDWSTFVNFLFPMHDEFRNGKTRPEKDPERLSFVGQDISASRDRILAVIAEWNENFFNPRRIQINADFSPLPAYPSHRSTAMPSAAQGPSIESRPLEPMQPTMYGEAPAQWTGNPSAPRRVSRSLSNSSSLSLGSSSSSSVDSIKSKDLEGADLGRIRSALLSFQMDATKKDHLRASVRQLRDEFRSQRQDFSGKDGKGIKKEYKIQRKEIKKEVKAVLKEAKAIRRADRKIRKAERKNQRESKRAEHRGNDRIEKVHDKAPRAEERAAERARRAQERGREVEDRASERAARANERGRDAQAQGAAAVARARERVADARSRGWDGEAAATQRVQEVRARAGAAERRAQETAGRARYAVTEEQETGVMLREG